MDRTIGGYGGIGTTILPVLLRLGALNLPTFRADGGLLVEVNDAFQPIDLSISSTVLLAIVFDIADTLFPISKL